MLLRMVECYRAKTRLAPSNIMRGMNRTFSPRREFLRFLATSPLMARARAQEAVTPGTLSNPKDALNVMDFEPLARKALPPAHWGYLATGVDDDVTLRAKREAFGHFQLRPRRLVDVSMTDLKIEVLGATWDMPIYVSAVAGQKAFHPEGELATARAARAKKTVQMLSTQTSTAVEDVATDLGTPAWFQLYIPHTWEETEKLVRRVEAAGCPVLAWTIDFLGGMNPETALRYMRLDTRNCLSCHKTTPALGGINPPVNLSKPMWKKMTTMKLVLKGIVTAEDATLAVKHGADGVIVSNHAGRVETGRGTIDILLEVVDAVGGRIPVLVDGGFRRGSDVHKALAIGARAVGIGRPYLYGLASFGQEGVERVRDILRAELAPAMRHDVDRANHPGVDA